jgi:hypothetical protein
MILTPICRLYSTEQQAQAVVQELTDRGFPSRHVYSLKASDRESADDDTIANNIVSEVAAELQYHESIVYARLLTGSKAVVACSAEFGYGELATRIMDSGNPDDVGHIPQIPKRSPSPLSDLLGLPTLSKRQRMSRNGLYGMPRLTVQGKPWFGSLLDSTYNASSAVGAPLLSNDATPLSARLEMQTLSQNATPLSTFLRLPVLKKREPE